MAEGRKTGGRAPGTPNKATSAAREAIAQFVDGNAHRLTEWLDRVADGVKVEREDPETGVVTEEYIVAPNPAKAFDMFQSVVEYHIPKLARQELVGDPNKPLEVDLHVTVFGELLKSVKMQRQLEAHGDKE
jgi:hypothetical protein